MSREKYNDSAYMALLPASLLIMIWMGVWFGTKLFLTGVILLFCGETMRRTARIVKEKLVEKGEVMKREREERLKHFK